MFVLKNKSKQKITIREIKSIAAAWEGDLAENLPNKADARSGSWTGLGEGHARC